MEHFFIIHFSNDNMVNQISNPIARNILLTKDYADCRLLYMRLSVVGGTV